MNFLMLHSLVFDTLTQIKGSYTLKPKSQEGPSLVCVFRQKALMTCSYGSSWEITPAMLWMDVMASSAAGEWCVDIFSWGHVSLFACTAFVQCSLLNVNVLLKCTASNALLLLFNCWLIKCFIHIIFFTSPPACSAKCKTMITVFLWLFNVNLILFFVL